MDYVYAGGDGQPPPLPPRKFWNLAWRNSQGEAGAQEWFAGYRHGAEVARNGGYRGGGIVISSYRVSDEAGAWASGPAHEGPIETAEPIAAPGESLAQPPDAPARDGEPLPAPPSGQPGQLGPPATEPFQDMLPPDESPRSEAPAGTTPDSTLPAEAPGTDAPAQSPESEPRANELFQGAVNPASATSPVNRGAQRFRRAVSTVRIQQPASAQ